MPRGGLCCDAAVRVTLSGGPKGLEGGFQPLPHETPMLGMVIQVCVCRPCAGTCKIRRVARQPGLDHFRVYFRMKLDTQGASMDKSLGRTPLLPLGYAQACRGANTIAIQQDPVTMPVIDPCGQPVFGVHSMIAALDGTKRAGLHPVAKCMRHQLCAQADTQHRPAALHQLAKPFALLC